MDIKILTDPNGMNKSAIIYRDDSARFIYVCFHCGRMFDEIKETLLHIESHFTLVNVTVEPFIEDCKQMHLHDNYVVTTAIEPIDIKLEIPESDHSNDGSLGMLSASVPIIEASNYAATDSTQSKRQSVKRKPTSKVKTSKKKSSTVDGKRKKAENHGELPYRCHKCPVSCKIMSELRNHMQKHTVKELLHVYRCKICDEYFKNSQSLRVHTIGVHMKTRKFKCTECNIEFTFAQSKKFAEHLQVHNQSDAQISACMKEQKNDDYSIYEEVDVFTEPRHSCEYCALTFHIKSNLDVHTQRKHPNPRRLPCSECSAVFSAPRVKFKILIFPVSSTIEEF